MRSDVSNRALILVYGSRCLTSVGWITASVRFSREFPNRKFRFIGVVPRLNERLVHPTPEARGIAFVRVLT